MDIVSIPVGFLLSECPPTGINVNLPGGRPPARLRFYGRLGFLKGFVRRIATRCPAAPSPTKPSPYKRKTNPL